jgi:hypothetical protein
MPFITISLLPQHSCTYLYVVFLVLIFNPAEDDICICSRTSFKAFVLWVRMVISSTYASICHVK